MKGKNETCFSDFTAWLNDKILSYDPIYLVAIARGAVRLYQLLKNDIIKARYEFLSDEALPFLSDEQTNNKKFLLFDDSVIFGSSLSRILEYLEARKAAVKCASYIVDRRYFLGEKRSATDELLYSPHSDIQLDYLHKEWPARVRYHHGLLVRKILNSRFHYNLDFPTFCIKLFGFGYEDIGYFAELIKKCDAFSRVENVSCEISENYQIPRYTAILKKQYFREITDRNITFRPCSKIRFVFIPETREILYTPITQLKICGGLNQEEFSFHEASIQSTWKAFSWPDRSNSLFYNQSVFRLLTSFISIIIGMELYKLLDYDLNTKMINHDVSIDNDDIRIVLGEKNTRVLSQFYSENITSEKKLVDLTSQETTMVSEEPNNEELRSDIVSILCRKDRIKLDSSDIIDESIGKILIALKEATDSDEKRRINPLAGRMDVGLNFSSFQEILTSAGGIHVPDETVSLALDSCIDTGLAVPKIVEEKGSFFRAFYVGEDVNDQQLLQYMDHFRKAYAEYLKKKKSRPLDRFEIQKMAVTLKNLMPNLPWKNKPHIFGYISTVKDKSFVDWLIDGQSPACRLSEQENRIILKPIDTMPSPVEEVWENPEDERNFYELVEHLGFVLTDVSDNAALLLSSCCTHKHTYNCIAEELCIWSGYYLNDFGSFLTTSSLSLAKDGGVSASCLNNLYWCIRYVTEMEKKRIIFYRLYQRYFAELERSIKKYGGSIWWKYFTMKGIFDSREEDILKDKFANINNFIFAAKSLTLYAGRLIIDSNRENEKKLHDIFSEHGPKATWQEFSWFFGGRIDEAIRSFNDLVSLKDFPGSSLIKQRLEPLLHSSQITLNGQFLATRLKNIEVTFNDFEKIIKIYLPKDEKASYKFPFTPSQTVKELDNGSIQYTRANIYILAMDIIKSAPSSQTNKVKNIIRKTIKSFGKIDIEFQDTTNDQFLVISYEPRILWDIAVLIKARCKDMMSPDQPFLGTRKGINFGSLIVEKKKNGEVLFFDTPGSKLIPESCYMLEGIDKFVSDEEKNSAIIIEASRAFINSAKKLKLKESAHPAEKFKASKHFEGIIRIIEL